MDQSKWCKIQAIRICHKRSKSRTNHKRTRRWDKKVDRRPIVMGLQSQEHSCFNVWIEEVKKRGWVGDPTSVSQRIVLATDAPVAIRDGWPGWTEYTHNLPFYIFFSGTTCFVINSSFPVPTCPKSRRPTMGGWNQATQLTDGWAVGLSWTLMERPRSNQSWANSWSPLK